MPTISQRLATVEAKVKALEADDTADAKAAQAYNAFEAALALKVNAKTADEQAAMLAALTAALPSL